ncbi:hypothetical protein K438DRAFT_1962595 [Mycena galopus ATCC 62051]|nr:hypothetical protein K438DRAFT_1962595 [Mycena galopus ATCC 62051]
MSVRNDEESGNSGIPTIRCEASLLIDHQGRDGYPDEGQQQAPADALNHLRQQWVDQFKILRNFIDYTLSLPLQPSQTHVFCFFGHA